MTRSFFLCLLLISLSTSALAKVKIHDGGGGGGGGDGTPPTGTITINAGAAYTRNSLVTLPLPATDDSGIVSQMRVAQDGGSYTTPEPYATTKPWTLSSGDGSKIVSVQFCDPSGNWSASASATIRLDTTPPHVGITVPTDGQLFGKETQ